MATGAAYKYPGLISHPLDCREDSQISNLRDDEITELKKRLEELEKEN